MISTNPSTLNSQPSTFIFPPSIQSDLFNYLKEEQQNLLKPILRVFKKPAQEELCCALLDYMETGEMDPPRNLTLGGIYLYCCQHLTPLHSTQPKKLGDIIKGYLPFLGK